MPAAWPVIDPVVLTRAEDSANWSADKQRPATIRFFASFAIRHRSGIWYGGTCISSFGRM